VNSLKGLFISRVIKIKTLLIMAATATLLIPERLLFNTKNSRILEPPKNITPHKFYLAFLKKNHLTL
jgi:hypothetical protein